MPESPSVVSVTESHNKTILQQAAAVDEQQLTHEQLIVLTEGVGKEEGVRTQHTSTNRHTHSSSQMNSANYKRTSKCFKV